MTKGVAPQHRGKIENPRIDRIESCGHYRLPLIYPQTHKMKYIRPTVYGLVGFFTLHEFSLQFWRTFLLILKIGRILNTLLNRDQME